MKASFLRLSGLARITTVSVLLLSPGTQREAASADSGPLSAGSASRDQGVSPPRLRTSVDLVAVPVIVTDRNGRTVTGLDKSAFTVFEQGEPQQIASFGTEDAPCSIVIVLDTSASMREVRASVSRSVRALTDTLHSDDEVSLITVSNRPRLMFDFTNELSVVNSHLLFTRFSGNTALVDSIRLALEHMRRARNGRRVSLVISDGRDNRSRTSSRELIRLAVESDAQIYTVGIAEVPRNPQEANEHWSGVRLLEDLAYATGGLHFQLRDANDLEATAARFGRAMHDQYLITYYAPSRSAEGKWRKIEVKVANPQGQRLRVLARRRYFSYSP